MKFKKPGKKKKTTKTKTERDHLNYIASLPCAVETCKDWPVNVHHIRESGEPRSHFKCIPLCYLHHQGAEGLHHLGKDEWRKRHGNELEMLEKLNMEIK